jgi:hypothetical protein
MLDRLCAVALLSAVLLSATAPVLAADVEPPKFAQDARNPAPKAALNTFQRFELAPVAMGAPFTEYETNQVALAKLQANVDERVKPVVSEWNARAAGEAPRTLRLQPEIRYIRFITGGKRFFGGAFAGGSSVHLKVTLTDAATGEVIAEPDFYQHANAFGAAWSFGGTDKHMLIRLSAMLADYLQANYASAVGGAVTVAPGHDEEK